MKISLFVLILFSFVTSQSKVMTQIISAQIQCEYAYAGHSIEMELADKKIIYNMRAREYDSQQRRFLSADKKKEQW